MTASRELRGLSVLREAPLSPGVGNLVFGERLPDRLSEGPAKRRRC